MEEEHLAITSLATSFASIPLQDVSQSGALISILISIFSGIMALIKHFKKPKAS